jgi:hypothetical protein
MDFRRHSELEGKHAILSASKSTWLRYTDERMAEFVENLSAARRGTELHELASRCIKLRVPLENTGQTLNMYVNDAIGYRMTPELVLAYSQYAFGTADALSFRDYILRIFDLKTGQKLADGEQLEVYAAYFCLEYGIKPGDIKQYDLRIYQNDEIIPVPTSAEDIAYVMSRIVELNELIKKMYEEEV